MFLEPIVIGFAVSALLLIRQCLQHLRSNGNNGENTTTTSLGSVLDMGRDIWQRLYPTEPHGTDNSPASQNDESRYLELQEQQQEEEEEQETLTKTHTQMTTVTETETTTRTRSPVRTRRQAQQRETNSNRSQLRGEVKDL